LENVGEIFSLSTQYGRMTDGQIERWAGKVRPMHRVHHAVKSKSAAVCARALAESEWAGSF